MENENSKIWFVLVFVVSILGASMMTLSALPFRWNGPNCSNQDAFESFFPIVCYLISRIARNLIRRLLTYSSNQRSHVTVTGVIVAPTQNDASRLIDCAIQIHLVVRDRYSRKGGQEPVSSEHHLISVQGDCALKKDQTDQTIKRFETKQGATRKSPG